MFAAAVFLILLAVVMISIAFGFALTNIDGIGPALAFLIVFGVYVLIALILSFIGYRKIKKVKAPEQTIAAMKSNKADPRPGLSPDQSATDVGMESRHVAANGARFHVVEAGTRARRAAAARLPARLVVVAASADAAGRGRLPRRRDGSARLRRQRQDAARATTR